jgi:TetR/AcrR family transcriptional repressor of nem operon
MARHDFRRGCLIGNLGQEVTTLPDPFRARLMSVLTAWQDRTALCLSAAQKTGEIAADHDPAALAEFFWTGWEGAVLRARLDRSALPLQAFSRQFFLLITP